MASANADWVIDGAPASISSTPHLPVVGIVRRGDFTAVPVKRRRVPQGGLPVRSHRHLDQVGPLTQSRSRLCPLSPRSLLRHERERAARGSARGRAPRARRTPRSPVYEMADFQCPACRMFAVTVLPTIDSEYVQTGKVRWGVHQSAADEYSSERRGRRGRRDVRGAAGTLSGRHHRRALQTPGRLAKLAEPRSTLVKIAQRAGVDRTKLLACLDDDSVRREIELDAQRATRSGANATPTFYIEAACSQARPTPPTRCGTCWTPYTRCARAHPSEQDFLPVPG